MLRKLVLTTLAAASTAVAFAAPAQAAEPKIDVDWTSFMVKLDAYVRTGSEGPVQQGRALEERTYQPLVQNAGNAWFGVAPSVTLVARDWGNAFRLAGDQMGLTDAMRLSSSTRMVISRVRLADNRTSRITPFAQLGFGQWRTDTNILPQYKYSIQVAAQFGGGVELSLAKNWQIACETSATVFIRDERGAEDLPATKMWSTTIASRMTF